MDQWRLQGVCGMFEATEAHLVGIAQTDIDGMKPA